MPEIKLKNCPFCGSSRLKLVKKNISYKEKKAYVASIRCNCCNARGGTVLNLTIPYAVKEDVENEAIQRWNRRSDDLIRCKDCKYLQKQSYENFGKESYIRYGCKYFCDEVHLDGFCSSAVRRSEND